VRLEHELERRAGFPDRRAVVVSSGTAGLVAALLALDVRGTVAIPSFTFPATANAVMLAGCDPSFVDISPTSWELDLAALERTLQRVRVGAILHVRSLGICRALDQLEELARAHDVPLIVDSAACLGGVENGGAAVGGRGDAEVFSMHATKTFGIGEGGVVMIRRDLEQRLRQTINFGLVNGVPSVPGLNAKLSEVQAAIGLAVLDRLDRCIARRSEIARTYRAHLGPGAGLQHCHDPGLSPWQAYPVAVASGAEAWICALAAAGVEARRYYAPPLHRSPAFDEPAFLPATDDLSSRMVCLPVYSDMADRELEEIMTIANFTLSPPARQSAASSASN
jgi:dTDP-4-amino-4,6-dideoxygalactose transaminase